MWVKNFVCWSEKLWFCYCTDSNNIGSVLFIFSCFRFSLFCSWISVWGRLVSWFVGSLCYSWYSLLIKRSLNLILRCTIQSVYLQSACTHTFLQIRGKIYCTQGQQTPKSALGRRTASVNDDINGKLNKCPFGNCGGNHDI